MEKITWKFGEIGCLWLIPLAIVGAILGLIGLIIAGTISLIALICGVPVMLIKDAADYIISSVRSLFSRLTKRR